MRSLAVVGLALAGLTPPAAIEGPSLVPIVSGESRDWRKLFMVDYCSDTVFSRVLTIGHANGYAKELAEWRGSR